MLSYLKWVYFYLFFLPSAVESLVENSFTNFLELFMKVTDFNYFIARKTGKYRNSRTKIEWYG